MVNTFFIPVVVIEPLLVPKHLLLGKSGFNFPNKNNTCGHSWFGKVQQMIIATASAECQ